MNIVWVIAYFKMRSRKWVSRGETRLRDRLVHCEAMHGFEIFRIRGDAVNTKQKIIALVLLPILLIGGCSAEQPNDLSKTVPSEYSDESSAPFDLVSEPLVTAPELKYLGSTDLTGSPAYKLYLKGYAQNTGDNVIEWEYVSSRALASRLSERISADLSPDLCDKIDNSIPYLTNKNLYEDLTEYIDITAPQWEAYAEYITRSGKARYFYPTTITVSPYVLLYRKSAFPRYGTEDPLTLWNGGEWTFGTLEQSLGGNKAVGGTALAENLLAASGTLLFSVDPNGRVTSNLHSESFFGAAAFIAANSTAKRSYYLTSGIESLQSGEFVYLSITADELDRVRRDYPEIDFGIVPFPRSDDADTHYYYASAEGYLVPKRAKNIKAAASFINCSRIAAQNNDPLSERTHLLESDVKTLMSLRSAELSQLVFDTNRCLDDSTSSAVGSIFSEIYTKGSDTQSFEEFIKSVEAPILKSISEINQPIE